MSETWEYGEATDLAPDPEFPWPPADDGPILAAFGDTWQGATFDPGRFFADTPREEGTGPALLYYLAIGILVAGATLFWQSTGLLSSSMAEDPLAAELGYDTVSPLVRFLLAPAFLVGGLFVFAGIVHVLLLIFDGATHGFGTTVRVFCYANSPTLFGVVPILGTIVGGIWSLVLIIIGLREAHETAAWKPTVAVLVPFIGMMLLFFLAVTVLFMAAGSAVPAG